MTAVGGVEIAVCDTVRDVRPAAGDRFLGTQWLRELGRLEGVWRDMGAAPRYAVALDEHGTAGLVPVYPALGRHYAGLSAADIFPGQAAPRLWRRGAWIGSDGTTSSSLAGAGRPGVAEALVAAAVALAASGDPDHICVPYLDDDQHRAVAAAAPAAGVLSSERGEAVLDLAFDSFEEYVRALPSRRTAIRRERRRFLASALAVRCQPVTEVAGDLAGLLTRLEQKYGGPASRAAEEAYLAGIAAAMGDAGAALMAYDGERPVAGSVLWDLGADWRVRCWGCDPEHPAVRRDHVYFNLMYYEPMLRARVAGARRLQLGTGSLDTKVLRGAWIRRRRSVAWAG